MRTEKGVQRRGSKKPVFGHWMLRAGLSFILLVVIQSAAFSAHDPAIERGLQWLYSHQNADSSWGRTDLANFRDTKEVLSTLIFLREKGAPYQGGLNWVTRAEPDQLNFLSQKVVLLVEAEQQAMTYVMQLVFSQAKEGGFGYKLGYNSDLWNTILALDALGAVEYEDQMVVGPAMTYVLRSQNQDGGFPISAGGPSNVFSTAVCVLALKRFPDWFGVPGAMQLGVTYLKNQVNPDGGYGDGGSSVYETALVWLVFRELNKEPDLRIRAKEFIASHQLPDGSWNGSAYETALALKVIEKGMVPNLVVNADGIAFSKRHILEGDTVMVTARVFNNWDGEARNVAVRFRDGDSLLGPDQVIPVIVPGETAQAQMSWPTTGKPGMHTIRVKADPLDSILESSEKDNEAYADAFVQSTIPPESLDLFVTNAVFSPNGDSVKDETKIYYKAPKPVSVNLWIKDWELNVVRTLVQGRSVEAGQYSEVWEGRGSDGTIVKDGNYFVVLELTDQGGSQRTLQAPVALDNNRITIFESLEPYKLSVKEAAVEMGEERGRGNPVYSPAGDRIAFISDTAYYSQHRPNGLWVMNGDGTSPVPVVADIPETLEISDPVWSPDGSKILYTLLGSFGGWHRHIYSVKVGGTENRPLAENQFTYAPSFSPDGSKIAYVAEDTMGVSEIWMMAPDGSNKRQLTSFQERMGCDFPVWSPSGEKISFLAPGGGWGQREVWLMNPDGSGLQKLTQAPDSSSRPNTVAGRVKWNPRGSALYYRREPILSGYGGPSRGNPPGASQHFQKGDREKESRWNRPTVLLPRGKQSSPAEIEQARRTLQQLTSVPSGVNSSQREKKKQPGPGPGTQSSEFSSLWKLNLLDQAASVLIDPVGMGRWDGSRGHLLSPDGNWLVYVGLPDAIWASDTLGRAKYEVINLDSLGQYIQFSGTDLDPTMRTMISGATIGDSASKLRLQSSLLNLTADIAELRRDFQNPKLLTIVGTAEDANFESYRLEYGVGEVPSRWYMIGEDQETPVVDGVLGDWIPPEVGTFTVRLTVRDMGGNHAQATRMVYWQEKPFMTDLRIVPPNFSPNGDGIKDSTRITYRLVELKDLAFKIYDPYNYPAKTFDQHHDTLGTYSFVWDGKDGFGRLVSEGRCRVKVEGVQFNVTMDTTKPRAAISIGFGKEYDPEIGDKVPILIPFLLATDKNFLRYYVEFHEGGERDSTRRFSPGLEGDSTRWLPLFAGKTPVFVVDASGETLSVGIGCLEPFSFLGTTTFRITVEDKAGNVSAPSCTSVVEGVRIFSPVNNDSVDGKIRISAITFFPNVKEVRFSYRSQDSLQWNDLGAAQYRGKKGIYDDSLDFSPLPIGYYWIKVNAMDMGDSVRTDTVRVKVGGDLVIVKPGLNSRGNLSGVVPVEAEVKGTRVVMQYVKFSYLMGNTWFDIGTPIYQPPYQVLWDTDPLPLGDYSLRARGPDTTGKIQQDIIPVTVGAPLRVTLINPRSPERGKPIVRDNVVELEALASLGEANRRRGGRITQVVFQSAREGISEWEDLAIDLTEPYTARWDTDTIPEGAKRLLRAIANDNYNNQASSDQETVIIDHTPPTAFLTYPIEGETLDVGSLREFIFLEGVVADSNLGIVGRPILYDRFRLFYGEGRNPTLWHEFGYTAIRPYSGKEIIGELGNWRVNTLASGDYTLRLYAEDLAGHHTDHYTHVYLTNSNPFPRVAIESPLTDSYLREDTTVIGMAEDSDLTKWVLSWGGGPGQVVDSGFTNVHGPLGIWRTREIADGHYTLSLIASDQGGRQDTSAVAVVVDNTPPVDTITVPQDTGCICRATSIRGTSDDVNFKNYRLEIGQGDNPLEWTLLRNSSQAVRDSELYSLKTLPPNGRYTLRLTGLDKALNSSEYRSRVIVDTLPPGPPLGLLAGVQKKVVTLTWLANRELDLKGYHVYRDNVRIDSTLVLSPKYVDTLSQDGEYVYAVTAVDRCTLESKYSNRDTVIIDTSPPTLRIASPAEGSRVGGEVRILGTAAEAHFKEYVVSVGQDSFPTAWTELRRSPLKVEYGLLATWQASGLDSLYTLRLSGEDTYGNSDTLYTRILVDNRPPSAPTGLAHSVNRDTVTLTWKRNEELDLSGYFIFRNDRQIRQVGLDTFYIDIGVPDGLHRYHLLAVDSAGNRSSPSLPDTVDIDLRAPQARIVVPTAGSRVAGTVSIRAEAQDEDIAQVLFQYKPDSAPSWSDISADSVLPYTANWNAGSLTWGPYQLRAKATDVHNNTDTLPSFITVFLVGDTTAPSIPRELTARVRPDSAFLSWRPNPEPDLLGYNVFRDGDSINISLVTDTIYLDAEVSRATHHYQVNAVDTATNRSERTSPVEADLETPVAYLTYPYYYQVIGGKTLIRGTVSDAHFKDWTLYYGEGSSPTHWTAFASGTNPAQNESLTTWMTNGLGGDYTLRLVGRDQNLNEGESMVPVTIDSFPPANPVGLQATSQPNGTVLLAWQPNSEPDLAGYQVYQSTVRGSGYSQINQTLVTDSTFTTVRLLGGRTYYYVVTAMDAYENESGYSNEASAVPRGDSIDLEIASEDIMVFPPSPVAGETAQIGAWVHNLGSVDLSEVEVQILCYNPARGTEQIGGLQRIPILPAGGEGEIVVQWPTFPWKGDNTLYAQVDPTNRVPERDEENNVASVPVLVRTSEYFLRTALAKTQIAPDEDVNLNLRVVNGGSGVGQLNLVFGIQDSLGHLLTRNSAGDTTNEIEGRIWVEDSLPRGAQTLGTWIWDSTLAYRGKLSHTDSAATGIREHGFQLASDTFRVERGQSVVQYVYLDPLRAPREIMLEFQTTDSSREHRAYWGESLIPRGEEETSSRRRIGEIPAPGTWVRLEVPAEKVALENRTLTGISYLLYDGQAHWDRTDLGLHGLAVRVAPGESLGIDLLWNARRNPGGSYAFHTQLRELDSLQAEARDTFRIQAVGAIQSGVLCDRRTYPPNENVSISTTVRNASVNHPFENLLESVRIIDFNRIEKFTDQRSIAILPPQGRSDGLFRWNTGLQEPGSYCVKEAVISASQDTLASDSTVFDILPSGGGDLRLAGWIKAVPTSITYPDSFSVQFQVSNVGNVSVPSLILKASIVDPGSQGFVRTFQDTLALGVGASFTDTARTGSGDLALKNYLLLLQAQVPETLLTVASGGFRVVDVVSPRIEQFYPQAGAIVRGSVTLGARVADNASGVDSVFYRLDARPYVYLPRVQGDSLSGEYTTLWNTAQGDDGVHALVIRGLDHSKNAVVDSVVFSVDNTPPGPPRMTSPAESSSLREIPISVLGKGEPLSLVNLAVGTNNYQTVASPDSSFTFSNVTLSSGWNTLNFTATDRAGNASSPGIFHLMFAESLTVKGTKGYWKASRILCFSNDTLEKTFTRSALGGAYYRIIGNRDDFTTELRSGKYNTYLFFGVQELQYTVLYNEIREAVNSGSGLILVSKKYSEGYKLADVVGATFHGTCSQNTYTIALSQSVISPPDTFTYSGTMARVSLNGGTEVGHALNPNVPSVVLNDYGEGKAVLFTFGIADTAGNKVRMTNLLKNALTHVLPETLEVNPMASIPVENKVRSLGGAYQVNVTEIVPQATQIVEALSGGIVGGNTVIWNFPLGVNEERSLVYLLRLPDAVGNYHTATEVKVLKDGVYHLVDTLKLDLNLERTSLQLIDLAIARLDSLVLEKCSDKEHRDAAKAKLTGIRNRPIQTRDDLVLNITETLQAVDHVKAITVDTRMIRKVLDALLVIWEVRWATWTGKSGEQSKTQ